MGNIISKNHRNKLDEVHQTDNNLELYLNDVYEKECVLKASQEEVEFIQTGIETLVQDIVDEVLDIFSTHEKINVLFNIETYKTGIEKYFAKDLTDVYFPIKEGSRFQDLIDIIPAKSSIIKVGSFYEGTKNNFPDEFDYIFLLFCGRGRLQTAWIGIALHIFPCIKSVRDRKSFHYASTNGTREIYLNTRKNTESHGPAYKLEFIYKTGSTKERYIAVDLVPAYKIVTDKTDKKPAWYKIYFDKLFSDDIYYCIKPKSFHNETLSAESCFVVGGHISFTETEVAFIRNVLSRHHVKVYRILKFLINGHGDDESMINCLSFERLITLGEDKVLQPDIGPYKPYSSYQIKTMIIYHHDECRNTNTTAIGPCVLQVLEQMCKCKYTDEFPAFSAKRRYLESDRKSCLVAYLQSLIDNLKSMQTRTDRYSYERYKMKYVARQYLEQEQMEWLQHENRHTE